METTKNTSVLFFSLQTTNQNHLYSFHTGEGDECVLNTTESTGATTPLLQVRSESDIQSAISSRKRLLSSRIRELNRELLLDSEFDVS